MRCALITHPDHVVRTKSGRRRLLVAPKDIPESAVHVALSQGWIVIGTDTEVLEQPLVDTPTQSNVVRPEHGYGATRDDEGGD